MNKNYITVRVDVFMILSERKGIESRRAEQERNTRTTYKILKEHG